ncbi:MAG: hypothetical protein ACKVS8_03960 [Phycisphaerales bacterium]
MAVDPAWLLEQIRKREGGSPPPADAGSVPLPEPPRKRTLEARPLLHVNDLPRPVRRRLALGATCISAGLVVFAGPMAVVWALLFVRSQNWVAFKIADLMALASGTALFVALPGVVLWTLGFVILTPPVPGVPRDAASAQATAHELRGIMVGKFFFWPTLVRVCAACWALPLVFIIASVQQGGADTPAGASLAAWGYGALFFATLANAACCAHLRDVGMVVCDDMAANRAVQTMFLLPILVLLGPVLLLPQNLIIKAVPTFTMTTGGFQGTFLFVLCVAFIFYPCFRFVASVWSLGSSCRWSVANDIEREEKEARFVAEALERQRLGEAERHRLGEHTRREGGEP